MMTIYDEPLRGPNGENRWDEDLGQRVTDHNVAVRVVQRYYSMVTRAFIAQVIRRVEGVMPNGVETVGELIDYHADMEAISRGWPTPDERALRGPSRQLAYELPSRQLAYELPFRFRASLVVLNDGETYSDIEGCTIRYLPDDIAEDPEAIEDALAADELASIGIERLVSDFERTLYRLDRALADGTLPFMRETIEQILNEVTTKASGEVPQ